LPIGDDFEHKKEIFDIIRQIIGRANIEDDLETV
jgi:hypothetical protein